MEHLPKILIVDDLNENLILLSGIISRPDIEIITTDSGFEAIELAKNNEFFLIILDVQMPEIDGFETAMEIRELSNAKYTPIIFVSAIFQDEMNKIKGVKTGAVDFIPKPINYEILKGKVSIFLEYYEHKKQIEIYQHQLEKLVEIRTQELELAKQKAEESDKLKTAFLRNLSHELRTPLNAINGFYGFLNYPDITIEQKMEYIGYIVQSTNNLVSITDSIIELSRIETNNISIHLTKIEVQEIVQYVFQYWKSIQSKIEKENITLELLFPDEENRILLSNKNRLIQILNILIDNAFKFTDEGKISVGYFIENQKIIFFVKDTGIGVDKVKLPNIFNKFSKSEDKIKLYSGTGVSLAICKALIELMNGTIWVKSELSKGSEFYFSFNAIN